MGLQDLFAKKPELPKPPKLYEVGLATLTFHLDDGTTFENQISGYVSFVFEEDVISAAERVPIYLKGIHKKGFVEHPDGSFIPMHRVRSVDQSLSPYQVGKPEGGLY